MSTLELGLIGYPGGFITSKVVRLVCAVDSFGQVRVLANHVSIAFNYNET